VIQEKFYLNPFAITYEREAAATATVRRRLLPTLFVTGARPDGGRISGNARRIPMVARRWRRRKTSLSAAASAAA